VEPSPQTTPARPGRARVRSASAQDVKAATELVKRYWEAAKDREVRVLAVEELRWLARASLRGGGLNVVRVEGVVRGVVGWRRDLIDPTRGRILVLCVEPGDWEAGAFEALLEVAARGLSRAGCQAVDLWLDAEGSPARFAAESLGFEVAGDRSRPLGVLGEGVGAQTLEGVRYTRALDSLPFASELLRLSWPRFLFALALVTPFVLLALTESASPLPLTGLALPLGVLAPCAAEVWSRGRRRPGAVFGLACTFLAAALGIAWALHVAALDGGGPSSLAKSTQLFNPGIWVLGAHWAPTWLVAGLLSARSLRAGEQRSEAFLDGTAALVLGLFLGMLPVAPVGDGLGVLFGVFCCTTPTCWALGALLAFLCWFADDLRDWIGEPLDLVFAAATPEGERA
tara:strand:- start:3793 stop:4989 length:1197 start_codon:yes stop_codon:yes gene_type:complete